MKTNQVGVDLIKDSEGFSGTPYRCPAGIATIGYGSTFYQDGRDVTMSDQAITKQQAENILRFTLLGFENGVSRCVESVLNINQFSALVSFAYNLGVTNLRSSTLLKLVNANPDDVKIADEFVKWNKAGGKVLAGLTKRRLLESNLYFEEV